MIFVFIGHIELNLLKAFINGWAQDWYLQWINSGDTAVLHQATDMYQYVSMTQCKIAMCGVHQYS